MTEVHPVSKEQNEVLEQQRYLLERRMYCLGPAPPKLPLQECIELYFDEMKTSICRGTCTTGADAEQAGAGCLPALRPTGALCGHQAGSGVRDFSCPAKVRSVHRHALRRLSEAVHLDGIEDYIRTAQSGVITMTTDTYPVLRRIMAIYHQSGDDCSDDSVQRFCNAGKTKV